MPISMVDVLKALLPKGKFWEYKRDDTFDLMLKGSGAAFDNVIEDYDAMSKLRNPIETALFEDLEREFGIVSNSTVSEANRRATLNAIKYAKRGSGSYSYLQNMLRAAGFNVNVLPMVPWLNEDTELISMSFDFGNDIIVNSVRYDTTYVNIGQLGETLFQLGEPSCMVGGDMRIYNTEHIQPVPTERWRWPFLFFICSTSSYYDEVIVDGDMRAATTAAWTAVNSAVLAKEGDEYGWALRVSEDGVNEPAAKQDVLVDGNVYLVHGKVTKVSGTGAPTVSSAGVVLWTGTTDSGVEQEFNFMFVANDTDITFGGTLLPVLDFDSISVTEVLLRPPVVSENRIPTLINLVLKYKPIRSWGVVLQSAAPETFGEDDMTYRFQETSLGGTLDITDAEEAVHIIFKGTGEGYTARFDDAQNFSGDRLYRLTNQTAFAITVESFAGGVSKVLLPNGVMQCTLSDRTSEDGDWIFLHHVCGDGEEVPV